MRKFLKEWKEEMLKPAEVPDTTWGRIKYMLPGAIAAAISVWFATHV